MSRHVSAVSHGRVTKVFGGGVATRDVAAVSHVVAVDDVRAVVRVGGSALVEGTCVLMSRGPRGPVDGGWRRVSRASGGRATALLMNTVSRHE